MNEENKKPAKINCSWCRKEIECPEDMLNVEKHMCYECFKKIGSKIKLKKATRVHIDIPTKELKDEFENLK